MKGGEGLSQRDFFRLNNESSAVLNLIRAVAAQAVLLGHSLSYLGIYPFGKKIPYIQSLAVSIFFVLSGFLTMYSYSIKRAELPQYGLKEYMINRCVRIYSVFVPALVVVTGFDLINLTLHGDKYPFMEAFNFETFLANLLMLPNFPYFHSISIFSHTVFASARPLWTLPIEWFCYLMFGFLAYSSQKTRKNPLFWVLVFFCGIVPYHNFIWGINNGLTFTWLVGVFVYIAISRAESTCSLWKKPYCFIVLAFLGVITWKRIRKVHTVFQTLNYQMDYDPMYSVLLGVLLFVIVVMAQQGLLHIKGKEIIKTFSCFSFSLYITHYSIIDLVCRHFTKRGTYAYLLLIALFLFCNLFAYGFVAVFEKGVCSSLQKRFRLVKSN